MCCPLNNNNNNMYLFNHDKLDTGSADVVVNCSMFMIMFVTAVKLNVCDHEVTAVKK